MKLRSVLSYGFVAVSMVLSVASASAMQMVEGGFARSQAIRLPAPLTLNTPSFAVGGLLAEIGFTPRNGTYRGIDGQETGPSFSLAMDPAYGGGLSFLPPRSFAGRHRSDIKRLMVGGALELEELGILGGVARTTLFGRRADMLMAGMSYGGLQARVALGETAREVQGARDVMMLSTDVRLNRWMSVQGDLALSERNDESESLAVGRVGVRLQF